MYACVSLLLFLHIPGKHVLSLLQAAASAIQTGKYA